MSGSYFALQNFHEGGCLCEIYRQDGRTPSDMFASPGLGQIPTAQPYL